MERYCRAAAGLLAVLTLLWRPAPAGADEESPALRLYRDGVTRAVDRALIWLAQEQREDGIFPGSPSATNAVVGLAGMAFLGAGYVPGRPPYGDVLNRCTDRLLRSARPDGYLGEDGSRMYGHGICTLYLSEVAGMLDPAREARVEALLGRALRLILDAQKAAKENGADSGGWRYALDSKDGDVSVSAWQLMALRSARVNGAPVPESAIKDAMAFLDRCRHPQGGFRYVPRADWWYGRRGYWVYVPAMPGASAAALLCRELGGIHADEANLAAGNYLLNLLKGPENFLPPDHQEYATYYAAQGMFQLGGRHWEEFGAALYRYLLPRQGAEGCWPPSKSGCGPCYTTAMHVLALTVSYRQLPIYQR